MPSDPKKTASVIWLPLTPLVRFAVLSVPMMLKLLPGVATPQRSLVSPAVFPATMLLVKAIGMVPEMKVPALKMPPPVPVAVFWVKVELTMERTPLAL